jgi:S-methylmethionine-dependent homocysteine/selenocysteine methylase
LTDGGLETTLVFHQGLELPHFAAFDLLRSESGTEALRSYFDPYLELARKHQVGFILESATWRASTDWGERLGYDASELAEANRRAVQLLHQIRDEQETESTPMVVSGCLGPRGDGYVPSNRMNAEEAHRYHARQIDALCSADVDMLCAMTLNYVDEAIGIARAAQQTGVPVALSFTVETDGRLPSGEALSLAIGRVDEATDAAPAYYILNCAHPTHFESQLVAHDERMQRIRGIRANASRRSHAELDEAETLDIGNPEELGNEYRALMERLPHLQILGGCCGTDHRHIEEISRACL